MRKSFGEKNHEPSLLKVDYTAELTLRISQTLLLRQGKAQKSSTFLAHEPARYEADQ